MSAHRRTSTPAAVAAGAGLLAASLATLLAPAVACAQATDPNADFVSAAGQSDYYEMQAARVILTQSADPAVRGFAQRMLADHSRTSAALARAAAAAGLPPPPEALSGDQRQLLAALQSLKGADLDRTYMRQQVNAHASTLAADQAFLGKGGRPELTQVAREAEPIVSEHLAMAQGIAQRMGAD